MSLSTGQDIFFPGASTRADGRQLISLFQAAGKASMTYPNTHARLTSFIMDKDFWEGEYQKHRWLSGALSKEPPDFGSLDADVLTAALPIFGTATEIVIQAQYRKDFDRWGPLIERNVTTLVSGMPNLKDLILYNPPRMGLVSLFCYKSFLILGLRFRH